jgi:hypothetical protein
VFADSSGQDDGFQGKRYHPPHGRGVIHGNDVLSHKTDFTIARLEILIAGFQLVIGNPKGC